MSRQDEVKAFFEQPQIYLTYDYNLRIRQETVKGFIADTQFENVLDMPCGSGDISIPLSAAFEHLTLVDFAAQMVEIAKEKDKPREANRYTFIVDDFFKMDNAPESFDLIIALGILAHVESPKAFIDRLVPLLKPGGQLVLQNTNSSHWYSGLIRTYLGVRKLVGKDKYNLNKVKAKLVEETLAVHGLQKANVFRYNQSFLGFSRLFKNEKKYSLTRNFFGDHTKNKHASWGCDFIYHYRKP
jgi:2-polyprenyl-3-methyl-5-hydroxy-6-metoxy-1,4-benzoquinol methylase